MQQGQCLDLEVQPMVLRSQAAKGLRAFSKVSLKESGIRASKAQPHTPSGVVHLGTGVKNM